MRRPTSITECCEHVAESRATREESRRRGVSRAHGRRCRASSMPLGRAEEGRHAALRRCARNCTVLDGRCKQVRSHAASSRACLAHAVCVRRVVGSCMNCQVEGIASRHGAQAPLRQEFGEQQSLVVEHEPPAPRQGGPHRPLESLTRPAQQSALVSAAPPEGTHVVRQECQPLPLLPQ